MGNKIIFLDMPDYVKLTRLYDHIRGQIVAACMTCNDCTGFKYVCVTI